MRSRQSKAAGGCRTLPLAAIAICLLAGVAHAHAPAEASYYEPAPLPAQETKPAPSAEDMGQLRPGESRRVEMQGGASHVFRVQLAEGQYARAVVAQDGMDVAVAFYGPGTELASVGTKPDPATVYMDSPNGTHGTESVSIVARASGEYLLNVRSDDEGVMPGHYEVRLEGPRDPTAADLKRVAAELAFLEGSRLRGRGGEDAKQAAAKYTEALGLWRSLGDRYAEACTLHTLGQVYHRPHGNLPAALDSLNQALAIYRDLGDLVGQAMANNDMGAAVRDLDSPRNALPYYDRAYELYERAGDEWGKAQLQNNIGIAYARLGEFREALRHYEQALPSWQSLRDRKMEALAYNNIGGVLGELGDLVQALARYQQALAICAETKYDRLAASAYNNVGTIYDGFGDTQAALDSYEHSLALHRGQKNEAGEANVLNNIGMAYAEMGDTDRALEHFNLALPIWQRLNQKRGQASTFDNLGYASYLLGKYDQALGYYEQARRLFAEVGDAQGEAYALTHTGMLHAARADTPKALDSYQQARKIQQDGGLKLGLAITLDKIACAYAAAGDATAAAASFQEALALWTELGEERGRAASLYGLARVESARGNLAAARDKVEQAIKIVESLRARTGNQQLRTTLLASKHSYYELDIDLKMRLAESAGSAALVESAFESSEQARARGLVDLLSEGRADLSKWVSPALADEKRELERRLGAVSDRLLVLRGSRPSPRNSARVSGEIESLKKEFDALSSRYDDVQARIRSQSPRYAQLTQPSPAKASALRQLLDPDTVLLEYALGEERSYLWAVTSAGVEGYRLRGRAEIQKAAEGLRELLLAYESPRPGESGLQYIARLRESARQQRSRAAELGQLVLGPVAGRIGSKRLVIVSDGALQFIPFEALFAPGTPGAEAALRPAASDDAALPLGMTNEVVYLPSASTLALLRATPRTPAAKDVAVFADPVFDANDDRVAAAARKQAPAPTAAAPRLADLGRALRDVDMAAGGVKLERLRYTLNEADAILSVVPAGSAMKAVSFGASRTTAVSPEVRRYRIVHFATHALLDDRRPELSGLVMSLVDEQGRPQDGFLRLGDIYNLDLPAEMVVLSACRTGIGKEVRGEGLIGLTRGFIYAGASRVVASLWKVDDEATAELMKSFYRHMLKDRLSAAAALRLAKRDVMQARVEWRAPYFWAGFVLQGEWRPSQPVPATAPGRDSSSGTH